MFLNLPNPRERYNLDLFVSRSTLFLILLVVEYTLVSWNWWQMDGHFKFSLCSFGHLVASSWVKNHPWRAHMYATSLNCFV